MSSSTEGGQNNGGTKRANGNWSWKTNSRANSKAEMKEKAKIFSAECSVGMNRDTHDRDLAWWL
jgi:hypothetical protein